MTPSDIHKAWAAGVGVLLLVGGFLWFRASERHAGAIAVLTHQVDSTVTVQKRKALSDSLYAAQAVRDAETQKGKALALVAAGRALQSHTDSIARSAADARALAERTLADSQATVSQLRSALSELRLASLHDSDNAKQSATRADGIIHALMGTLVQDSLALSAERSHAASLQALATSLQTEVGLLKKSQPSKFWGVVKIVGVGVVAFEAGHILK